MFDKVEPWFLNDSYNKTKIPYDYMSILHAPFDWFSSNIKGLQTGAFSNSGVVNKRVNDYQYYDSYATIRTRDYR